MSTSLEKIFKIENNILKSVIDVSSFYGRTLGDEIIKALKKNAEKVIIIDGVTDQHLTGHQLFTAVTKLASSLIGKGLSKGDVIGFYNDETHLSLNAIGFMATIIAGLTYIGCDCACPYEELLHKCKISNIKVLVTSESILGIVLQVQKQLSQIKHVFILDKPSYNAKNSTMVPPTTLFLFDLPSRHDDHLPVTVDPEKDSAAIVCSSGTSGLPKAVCLSHRNILSNAAIGLEPFNVTSRPGEIFVITCPIMYGTDIKLFFATLFYGNQIVLCPSTEPSLFYAEKYHATAVFSLPTQINILAEDTKSYSLESVTDIIMGGSRPDPRSCQKFMTRNKLKRIRNVYGMTEVGWISMMPLDFSESNITCSGVVLPGVQLKVVKSIDVCGPKEIGKFFVKSPMKSLGYLNNEQANREAFDDDGFFETGDVGYFDNNGFVHVTDRYKDVIVVNESKISPTEIEEVLMMHEAVQEAAVFAKVDHVYGEVPKAFVVLNHGKTTTESELINFVRERLNPLKHLKGGVEFMPSFPRTSRGKIDRKILKQKV